NQTPHSVIPAKAGIQRVYSRCFAAFYWVLGLVLAFGCAQPGMTLRSVSDDLIVRRIGENGPQKLVVQGMAGLDTLVKTQNRHARQIQIADGVQNLVADEFIREAQAVFVEDLFTVEHDGVI